MKLIKQIAILAGSTILAATALAQTPAKAPNFTLKDANGQEHSLAKYAGKVVVLEFTNPGSPVSGIGGCPFMIPRYEHKIMQGLAKQVTDAGGVYLAVNSTAGNTVADSQAIAKKYGVTYPILLDSKGMIARSYHAKTTPHMFVIGKNGNLVYNGALNSNNTPDTSKDPQSTHYVLDAVKAASKGEAPKIAQTQPYGCGIKLK